MSESHGSVSQDYQSDTSTSENNRLFSFEQSPTLFCPFNGEQKSTILENGIMQTPHMNIVEVQYKGSGVEVKQEMVLEDSSVFLACDDKPCLLGLNRENEVDSSDSGDPSDSEKVTPIASVGNKLQVMECPQFIHRNNDALDNDNVTPITSGQIDRTCQGQLTASDGGITVTLANSDMWSQFDNYGTEMVLTKRGRRMFPYIEVNIRSGLELDKDYILLMDMKPFDDHRYKFHDGNWIPSMKADPPPVSMMYIHSDSPQKGSFWLSHTISFRKLKLTNCDSRKGHILLNTQHKYTPRLHIVQGSDTNSINGLIVKNFCFPRTSFVTVSTYKNFQITQLKVDNNPFAKHFRNSYHTTKRVMKIAEIEGFANASSNQYAPQANIDSFQKHLSMLKQVASTSTNSIHIGNNTPSKTHALLHVDPSQSFAYTANSSDGQVINPATHFINEQTPILTMVPNSKGYAINTLPPKQNIYIQGSHHANGIQKSPTTQDGTSIKKIKLDTSPVQLHPPSSFISIGQPAPIPVQVSQTLGIQNSNGSIQILTNSNPQVTELPPIFTTAPQLQECSVITPNGCTRNNIHTTQSLPPQASTIQLLQNRQQNTVLSYNHQVAANPSQPPQIIQDNCHAQDTIKCSSADPGQTMYSLPNGTGSYVMAYLPILLPCKPNDTNGISTECAPPNIPILGSLPPGVNFQASTFPSVLPSVLPTQIP